MKMSEKGYRVLTLRAKAGQFIGKTVVLYGTGKNCEAILANCSELPVVGIMDERYQGSYFHGVQVIGYADAINLGVDTVIIAAQIDSAHAVYMRIVDFCSAHGIVVFDAYGNDMRQYERKLIEGEVGYRSLSAGRVAAAIKSHTAVGFCFEGVVCLCNEDSLFVRTADVRGGEELLKIKKNLIPRAESINLLKTAVEEGKEAFVVSDCGLTESFVRCRLADWGVGEGVKVFTSCESNSTMLFGLLREALDSTAEGSTLFFGCDSYYDGLAASAYGIDYITLKTPRRLFLMSSSLPESDLDKLKGNDVSAFLNDVFNDPFYYSRTNGELKLTARQQDELSDLLIESNLLSLRYNYKPVLVQKAGEIERLTFPEEPDPLVSIIIPVYNQFFYTWRCLAAIKQNSGDVSYEIILADDCSTDETREIEKRVDGIKVLHNTENLRFLKNCNNALRSARGEYVLFLNNDTQPQPGWLQPLVDLLEGDDTIGMTGSKLVYPDGSLQEAGGILWRDGSAWNYGHGDDPDDAKYNYVRDVDYISGASILVRRNLLEELGGFDPLYAPAYYEDTDLAFRIRDKGYRVVYQPQSVVIHFEGKSNGTDTSSGLKSYQVVNAKKFYDRWKDVLERDHFANGENVFLACNRSRYKKHILVIDHYIPRFDQDAGGRCTYMYLQQFVKMGMQVTFIGDNFAHEEPYRTALTSKGIEVLYGDWYYLNWKKWLADNGAYFDYCYPQRPHIAIKWIDELKEKCPNAKLFYFAHDLHHLREFREYQVTGDETHLRESEKWKKVEFKLFDTVDVVHVVGTYEQEYLQKRLPDKPIRNIPLYIYEEAPKPVEKDFALRHDIVFVGGFGHPPNEDAVLWFAHEIYPHVLEKFPNMVWHIVGNKPTEAVEALQSKNIVVHGRVSDEELEGFYRQCRLAVVPLRYGAGVKGKIVEAAYYQIPMVTTTIGAEGMSRAEGTMAVADTAEEQVETICNLYEDFDELRRMSDSGPVFIDRYFSQRAVDEVLALDMEA